MAVTSPHTEAWNNFVMRASPDDHEKGSTKRAAAIASLYLSLANNGGINSFLTSSNEYDSMEVLEALIDIGALKAAHEFQIVLGLLRTPIKASSERARFDLLEKIWTDEIDDRGLDVLSEDADKDLVQALERHVRENEDFYLTLR